MTPHYSDDSVTLWAGHDVEVLRELPDASVDCVVTSPPYYGLRDYGVDGQRGLEGSPAEYVAGMVAVFAEVRRVLADDGTLWLNLGDSYATQGGRRTIGDNSWTAGRSHLEPQPDRPRSRPTDLEPKNLRGIPWRVAFALQDAGWILRNDIIWAKANGMPESVTDRMASRHEHLFLFAKARRYWFDLDAVREPHSESTLDRARPGRAAPGKSRREGYGVPPGNRPHTARLDQINHPAGRNPGDVWTIPTQPFPEAHFAAMPPVLAERCVLAGCKPGGVVLDPYSGSGTTGLAAARHGRRYVGIDLNPAYHDLALRTRLGQAALIGGESA